ncbi:MAG: N-formylglutamate amidohydrolase [Candidatus Lokiarchaeota archaeon]|nr:N-formylglutamate amidohydrolase [Candidatus Lokiarchaeota archaeon]
MDFRKYFEFAEGSTPVILSCPHGGYKKPIRIPDKIIGPKIADKNTYFISKLIINLLKKKGINIYYILKKVHRSKLDLNRPPHSSLAFNKSSTEANGIFYAFHDQLIKFSQSCLAQYGRALVIDFHGFTRPYKNYPDVIFGHIFGQTLDLIQDSTSRACEKFWGCHQLEEEISKHFSIDNGFAESEYSLAYSGGYITHQFYNIKQINTIQVEVAKSIRMDSVLTKKLVKAFTKAIVNSINKV